MEGLHQILLSVNDPEVTVLVKFTNISRHEPAIIGKGVLRLFVIAIIAMCNTASTNENLTLRRIVLRKISRIGKNRPVSLRSKRVALPKIRGSTPLGH